MSVVLLNSVTGSVVYQHVHSGAAGPVHAVMSEHWVAYTLRDVESLRQQVGEVSALAQPREEQGSIHTEWVLQGWVTCNLGLHAAKDALTPFLALCVASAGVVRGCCRP